MYSTRFTIIFVVLSALFCLVSSAPAHNRFPRYTRYTRPAPTTTTKVTTKSTSTKLVATKTTTAQRTTTTPRTTTTTKTTYKATTTTSTPKTTTTAASSSNGDTYSGDGTYYNAGLGSCGWTNTDSDYIVAMNYAQMANGANPNNNPNCGRHITVTGPKGSVTVEIVDTCPTCAFGSVDLSPAAFDKIAEMSAGRVKVTWKYND